jgi:hypothetical protein
MREGGDHQRGSQNLITPPWRTDLNQYRQWRAILLLITCLAFIACSSEKGKDDGASDTGVAANGAAGPASGPANYGGAIDTINCDAISGWEWNSANSAEKINIDMFVDKKLVGTTPANVLRMDLKDVTGVANPAFAFRWAIPPELKDGKAHAVSAKISGGTQEVKVWENIKPSFTCSAH